MVPFDDELLKDFVMYTLDVPISRSFAIKGVTNLADRFCAIIRGHDGMEHLSDEVRGQCQMRILIGFDKCTIICKSP